MRRWSGEIECDGRINLVSILPDGTVFAPWREQTLGTIEQDRWGDWIAKSVAHGNAGFDTRKQALVWLLEVA
jgi:hypothetical protein